MPSFKPKSIKKFKINRKSAITLDGKHKEFINDFNKDEVETIPSLKSEKREIKKRLESLKGSITIEEKLDYEDQIETINNTVKSLKQKKKEYFLDNSKYIFDYFENKKNISNNESQVSNKNKLLYEFFKIKNNNVHIIENNNNNIFQKYLTNIDESFLDIQSFICPSDICQSCMKGELISMDDEGVLICSNCSKNYQYLIENEKPSYKEPPKEVCFYAYKKINHFKEILAQFQGKETTQIPIEVIENLKLQIKKERIEITKLTYYEMKSLLKKLGYNKYYEHINFIKDKLGIKPPIISQELEESLCNFFMEIQYPYAKHCPDYRVNFLHYYYVLFKLFELLGENQYLHEIPMLKDKDKLIEQDSIWKNICQELDWEYIPTI
jgi:hypothetical protein